MQPKHIRSNTIVFVCVRVYYTAQKKTVESLKVFLKNLWLCLPLCLCICPHSTRTHSQSHVKHHTFDHPDNSTERERERKCGAKAKKSWCLSRSKEKKTNSSICFIVVTVICSICGMCAMGVCCVCVRGDFFFLLRCLLSSSCMLTVFVVTLYTFLLMMLPLMKRVNIKNATFVVL